VEEENLEDKKEQVELDKEQSEHLNEEVGE
jgi:hypothetical protein